MGGCRPISPHNLDPSEGPWGGGFTHQAVHYRVADPAQYGKIGAATRCAKGGSKPDNWRRMPGAGLNRPQSGKAPPESQPSSRTGENPPYGMSGRIMETSGAPGKLARSSG
jgi:hypothetical protein